MKTLRLLSIALFLPALAAAQTNNVQQNSSTRAVLTDIVLPNGKTLRFVEGSAPSTPPSGQVVVYAKSDGRLYSKDDAGVETELGGGGGGGAFTDLSDVPSSYSGQAGKLVSVTSGEDGLEFIDAPSGTGDVISDTSDTSGSTYTGGFVPFYSDDTGKHIDASELFVNKNGYISFPSNKRQTFAPGANQSGLNVGPISSDPSDLSNGDVWYNSTTDKLKAYIDGATVELGGGGGAPIDATYITQTANGTLTNEQALSALATGILKNTTSTGVLSIATAGDFPTLNQNTTGSAATLTTSRSIYGNSFNGSADVTGVIASTYGGTGNGFTKFTGPASSEKTFTLPNASATILTTNAAVTVGQGGTGATTLTGLVKGNGTSAFTAATAGTDYEVPLTFSTGLTRSTNTVTVNTTQNIAKLSNLTSNGFVKTGSGDGTLSVDTTSYQTQDAALTALAGGSDFVQFTGPTTSTKVFTLPNASSTIYTSNTSAAYTALPWTLAGSRLLGNSAGIAGGVEEIAAGTSLSFSSGTLNTVQDIRTTATPTFAGITSPIGATTPSTGRFTTISASASVSEDASVTVENLSATGYGPYFKGGGASSRYVAQFVDYAGDSKFGVTGGGATVGSGGTGAATVVFAVDGGSASAGGAYISFRRNGTGQVFVGTESGIIGNNSNALALYGGANEVKIWAGSGGHVATFNATGINATAIGATTPAVGHFTSGSSFTGSGTGSTTQISFINGNGTVGSIVTNGSSTSYNTSSDRRFKTNIRDYLNSSRVIELIKVRQYDWKTGEKDAVGFVAQELYEVYPAAVTKGDDGDTIKDQWAVDYSKLVPVLVAEVQALRSRVAELERQPRVIPTTQ